MPSDQAFCNHPTAASGGRKRAAGEEDEKEMEKRPKLSDNGSSHSSNQSNCPGTGDGAPVCLNETENPPTHTLVTSSTSDPGPSNPSDPTEVSVLVVEQGPLTLSSSSGPRDATGPWRTTGLEHEQSGSCTNQTAEDSQRWSWSCSSSSSFSSSHTSGSPSPSSSCCCSREGDSPSRPQIPNGPDGCDGLTSLQGSETENIASEASSCGPFSRAEVEEEVQVAECLWQQDTSSDPDLVGLNAVGDVCSCSNDDDNSGSQKAVCDSDDQKVRSPSGSPIHLAKSSMWKSFINPSDPSGLKLILQRIPDPRDCPYNDEHKGEVAAGRSCEGAEGTGKVKVIKLRQLFPEDSNCPADLLKENELDAIASSDPCSCSWCCNSCSSSSSSNSTGGGSAVEDCDQPAAKVDEKNSGSQPDILDKTGKSTLQKSTVPGLQGGLEMQGEGEEPQEEDTASCSSCVSSSALVTHGMDQGVALCPSDASSSSWTDEAPDGYSKLVPSVKFS